MGEKRITYSGPLMFSGFESNGAYTVAYVVDQAVGAVRSFLRPWTRHGVGYRDDRTRPKAQREDGAGRDALRCRSRGMPARHERVHGAPTERPTRRR